MQDGINNNTNYKFNSVETSKDYMYYSNSDTAKSTLESWYSSKIASNTNYSSRVESGNYFCEQAKVASNIPYALNSGADMKVYNDGYTPDFKCSTDGNGKGIVNSNIGLITYDEVVYAGGYLSKDNSNYYLYNDLNFWTMSPAGFLGSYAIVWCVNNAGDIDNNVYVGKTYHLRPVINLKADTTVTGSGTSDSYWVVAN